MSEICCRYICEESVYEVQFHYNPSSDMKLLLLIIAHINSTNLHNELDEDRNQVSVISNFKGVERVKCAEGRALTGAQALLASMSPLDKTSTYASSSFGSLLSTLGREIGVKHLLLSLRGVFLLLLPFGTLYSNDQDRSRTFIYCDIYLRSQATRT